MHEKRMRKMDGVRARLKAPVLEGPDNADVTLIGWGSTWSVIKEAAAALTNQGITTNQLHFKYIHPFHDVEAKTILGGCRRTIMVENNFSGQFARHLRAETGFKVDQVITRYDGEPFEPAYITQRVKALVAGSPLNRKVEESEAREMAYHHIRLHMQDLTRPGRIEQTRRAEYDESLWDVEIIGKVSHEPRGNLLIGIDTGSIYRWEPLASVQPIRRGGD